jgi:large subunit ribosomal protein L21
MGRTAIDFTTVFDDNAPSCRDDPIAAHQSLSEVRLWLQSPRSPPDQRRHHRARQQRVIIMHAVIKTGGKQYRVAANDMLEIERLPGDAGATLEFTEVLMVGEGSNAKVGTPTVAGAKVLAELVEQTRGDKKIAFKKRRRKNSRRKKGHRQDLTMVRITSIIGA